MTDRATFENPDIVDPSLSADDLQKILTLQGDVLKGAVVRHDYAQLLDELCLLAESFTSNAVATVMLYDENRDALFVESAPSLTADAVEAFNGLRCGDGSCGNAVYHKEAMYVCNTLEDPRWDRTVDIAARYNICSCFSFPILTADGDAVGSFAISSFEPRTPDRFHQTLLDTCSSICGVILQRRHDDEMKRRLLEEQVKTKRVESLGTLAGGIAHDFNNLLTIIMGNVDLSTSVLPDGPAKEGLQLAMKAIESASELTRQLLTIAKGRSPIRVPNDVSSIIKDSADFALHGSNVSLEIHGLDDLPPPVLDVDGGQIGQLIQNLVLNARQAMPQGGVAHILCSRVNHEAQATLSHGTYLKIAVSDTGNGMSPEVADHIFEPYYTTRPEGSGLGLFLCYAIVHSHGGRIFVDSEIGAGTCFTIYLPWEELAAPVQTPPKVDGCVATGNVLIMDDDPLIRRTLGRILRQLGCEVWETAEGSEAVTVFKELQAEQRPVNLTILDLTIPGGMGGIETGDEIRRCDPAAKLVVSSGYSAGEACIDHEAWGFDAAMLKPYGVAEVRQVLGQLLN